MPDHSTKERESVHRMAFAHYLRTGERLTSDEWLLSRERKFNPYHDERGRFTSPPGTTVSYGRHGPRMGGQPQTGAATTVSRPAAGTTGTSAGHRHQPPRDGAT